MITATVVAPQGLIDNLWTNPSIWIEGRPTVYLMLNGARVRSMLLHNPTIEPDLPGGALILRAADPTFLATEADPIVADGAIVYLHSTTTTTPRRRQLPARPIPFVIVSFGCVQKAVGSVSRRWAHPILRRVPFLPRRFYELAKVQCPTYFTIAWDSGNVAKIFPPALGEPARMTTGMETGTEKIEREKIN